MIIARLILAIVILVFALAIVVMNWRSMIADMRNRRRWDDRRHSAVPLVSLILAAAAYLLYPWPDKIWMFAMPVLDIANWRLLWLPVAMIRHARTKEKD